MKFSPNKIHRCVEAQLFAPVNDHLDSAIVEIHLHGFPKGITNTLKRWSIPEFQGNSHRFDPKWYCGGIALWHPRLPPSQCNHLVVKVEGLRPENSLNIFLLHKVELEPPKPQICTRHTIFHLPNLW
ncbi:hypothetical protein YC2023_060827 [Brassica napus]